MLLDRPIPMPPEIYVAPVDGTEAYANLLQQGLIKPTTAVFRNDTAINEVVALALQESDEQATLEICSGGCSYGAELDTALGLVYKHEPTRDVAVRGVDYSDRVLAYAEVGKYVARESYADTEYFYKRGGHNLEETMDSHGFQIGMDSSSFFPVAVLDAARLRDRYSVKTQRADLTREFPSGKLAKLVLGNNLLFHHSISDARKIAVNLSKVLQVGGIISFGKFYHPDANGPYVGRYNHERWTQYLTHKLSQQGLEPITDLHPMLSAYRRVR
jgi:SAM-dependent methyltransferase